MGFWNLAHPNFTGLASSPLTPRPHGRAGESPILESPLQDPSRLSVHSDTPSIQSETDADDESSSWDSDEDESFAETEPSDDEEQEITEEQRKAEREARALERQLVLEAAGLIIKSDREPPPRPARKKSYRKRRPAPAVPEHRRESSTAEKEQPAPPESLRVDDAYERYEAYRQSNSTLNRLSIVSVDSTNSIMPSPSSPSMPRSPSAASGASTEHESRTSHFLHFFGRKAPANDSEERVRPVISGPILQDKEPGTLSAESDFGTVSLLMRGTIQMLTQHIQSWASLVDKSALEGIPAKERKRQEAIFEFITTEAAYVRDLQLIVEVDLFDRICNVPITETPYAGVLYQPAAFVRSKSDHSHIHKR